MNCAGLCGVEMQNQAFLLAQSNNRNVVSNNHLASCFGSLPDNKALSVQSATRAGGINRGTDGETEHRYAGYPGKPDFDLIPLDKGYLAIIDAEDSELVSHWTWRVSFDGSGLIYARRVPRQYNGRQIEPAISLHRLIVGATEEHRVDHRDGNGLDCRKHNLRHCSQSQNRANSKKHLRECSSIYKGVRWHKKSECENAIAAALLEAYADGLDVADDPRARFEIQRLRAEATALRGEAQPKEPK